MKTIWYHFVKYYIRIGFAFYFKKIQIHHAENIPKKKAVIFVANHQNALLDPILIGSTNPREMHYLTRAQVFKKPVIKALLHSINMLPIYRIRDGFESLSNNEAVFQNCYSLLEKQSAILIFPEGNHNLKRRVRILSKGFTRIVFGALEHNPNNEIVIVPVGINYSEPTKYASKVSLYYGKPIDVRPYWENYDKNDSVTNIKEDVREQLKLLTTHIEDLENYDSISNHFEADSFLFPEMVNKKIASSTNFPPAITAEKNQFNILEFLVKINSFFPLLIWKFIAPKIEEEEFIGTFKFTVGITAFPLFYVLQTGIIYYFFGGIYATIYITASFLSVFVLTKTK